MTCTIVLSKGMFATVDDEDFERLNRFKWSAVGGKGKWYAVRNITTVPGPVGSRKVRSVRMHQVVLGLEHGTRVDHRNGDSLDNRKENLRPATQQQNVINTGPQSHPGRTSKYKGVCWNRAHGAWIAQIGHNRKKLYIGMFEFESEAAIAYNDLAFNLFGDFAWLNNIPSVNATEQESA